MLSKAFDSMDSNQGISHCTPSPGLTQQPRTSSYYLKAPESKHGIRSFQQNSNGNISTAFILVLPLLSSTWLWGRGSGGRSGNNRKQTKRTKQNWTGRLWRARDEGQKSHFIIPNVSNRKKNLRKLDQFNSKMLQKSGEGGNFASNKSFLPRINTSD